jgi:hypothetical protein
MKYYKWRFNTGNTSYPVRISDLEINFSDGGDPSYGGYVVSCIDNALDVSAYSAWNMEEISQEQALNIATTVNPSAYVNQEGLIVL